MTGIDHRAEAERFAEIATEHADGTLEQFSALAFAQVHATLAGPATRILEIQGVDPRYDELRAAVREAVALSSGPVPFVPDVPAIERAWDRLRALVGGDS